MSSWKLHIAAGAALMLASGAEAQQTLTLTVAAGQPPAAIPSIGLITSQLIPSIDKRLADEKVGLKITWKEAYAGSLLKPLQVMDGTKDGVADIGYVPTIFHPDRLVLDVVSFVVPFVTTDTRIVGAAMNKLYAEIPEMNKLYEKFQVVRLGGQSFDSYELLTTFPVRSVDDLKGKKIATAGSALLWLRGTGATPVQSNMMEYYNGIKTGVYEGTIVFTSSFPGMKYPEVAPHVTKTGFGAMYAASLIMNQSVFNKLPPAAKKIFLEEAQKWGAASDKLYETAAERGYAAVPVQKGNVYELPRAEVVKWAKAMPNIAKEWAERTDKAGLPGSKALQMYMTELRNLGAKPARDWDKE